MRDRRGGARACCYAWFPVPQNTVILIIVNIARPVLGQLWVAFGLLRCYGVTMSAKMRRPLAVLLALALSLGLVMHSVPDGKSVAKAADMTAGMSMDAAMDMPTDMPTPGKCNGCAGDEKVMMPPACSAFCGSVVAIPLVPAVFRAIPIGAMWPAAGTVATGHTGPPDPYPPKPVVLS